MTSFKVFIPSALLILGSLGLAAYFTRDWWRAEEKSPTPAAHSHGAADRVKLSRQAQANLGLVVKPITLETYRRTIEVPAVVVERRGRGDRGFVAPAAGIVQSIAAFPGDTVQPGSELLTLRLNSEALQTNQTELFKAAQETRIALDQKQRLEKAAQGGAIAESRLLDLQYQLERLAALRKAYRADLAIKGLLPPQIDQIEAGNFIKEIQVRVPTVSPGDQTLLEVEEMKVQPGEQVVAGQLLGYVANHQNLFLEGRGFREDTALVEQTASQGWALAVNFLEEQGNWPEPRQPLTILYLANTIDPASQTFPFYVPLANSHREYQREGKTYRIWRFRPGQRAQLGVPIQELKKVFVLPSAAVARVGPEAYVFRQSGDSFVRISVQVLHEDATRMVLANDGSVFTGDLLAQNAAQALQRAVQAQAEESGGHGHDHHGHGH